MTFVADDAVDGQAHQAFATKPPENPFKVVEDLRLTSLATVFTTTVSVQLPRAGGSPAAASICANVVAA